MKVKLFQRNREPYFWSVSDLDKIEDGDIYKFSNLQEYTITFNNIEIIVNKNHNDNSFIEDGLNVIVTDERIFFDEFYTKYTSNYKFLILIKTIEDYWYGYKWEQDKMVNYVEGCGHIKVIWDVALSKHKNFYFEPKIHIQNYYNFDFAFPANLFLYGEELYENTKNKKRIGFHVNKIVDDVRNSFCNMLFDLNNDNLFFTVNKSQYNISNNKRYNYLSNVFDCEGQHHGLSQKKYIDYFINQTTKSEIEFVYETSTTCSTHLQYIKWNEKTIKNLYLGKPFVHVDPVSHKLIYYNQLSPYRSLYSDKLWESYESYDVNKLLLNKDTFWINDLYDNLIWLLEMDEFEWNNRLDESKKIAKKNKEKVFDLIFNTSLFFYIENYNNL